MNQWSLILGLALLFNVAARADETYGETETTGDVAKTERKTGPVKKFQAKPVQKIEIKKNQPGRDREPASFGRSEETMGGAPKTSDWKLRLDVTGGLATLSNNNTKDRTARGNSHFDRNLYMGLNTDFQWGEYLGANLDGYFSTGTSSTATVVDTVSGSIDNRERKLSQNGIALDVQGRYSLDHWGRKWNWRAGLGYGILSVSQTNPPVSLTATDSKFKVSGLYLTGGLEVRVIPNVSLVGDAAFSIGGSGTSSTTTASGTTELDVDSAKWLRFRLSASYELSPQYLLGLQYIRRELKGVVVGSTGQTMEGTDQFLTMFTVLL